MKILVALVVGMSLGGHAAGAQTTQAAIAARLMDKPLQLRGFWMDDKLRFDAAGSPAKAYKTDSFTDSGFRAEKVKLDGNKLEIDGDRVGLVYDADDMTEAGGAVFNRVTLRKGGSKAEQVKIEIAGGPGGDYTKALDAIFATSLVELAPSVPAYWQPFFDKEILHQKPAPPAPGSAKPFKKGGDVLPPRVVKAVDPRFSDAARGIKMSSNVLVGLIVDQEGMPEKVYVERPAGVGLDEQSVKAVSQYRFKPATKDGVPVKVELTVEVNFQIY